MPAHDERPMIQLLRLHRSFGRTKAVCDVSFDVYRGEVFGYIGPNGAGKTTSMRVLATLDLPTAGDACVDGFSVIDDPDRVRRRLGYMPDAFGVYANVSVREYLDFFARAYGLAGQRRLGALRHVLGFTTLDQVQNKPMDELSKGMKQRLCLARALIHDPAVLILDEPAAGLDPRARIELRQMIRQLAGEGKSILVSSHILAELAEMCDRVGIIERGTLLAVGTVDEIQQRRQPRRRVKVRVLGGIAGLIAWLTARGGVGDIQGDGDVAVFAHDGDRQSEVALLREAIVAGFPVAEFGSHAQTLEDVFMQVTAGQVQ